MGVFGFFSKKRSKQNTRPFENYDDEDEYQDPPEGTEITFTSDLGIEKHRMFMNGEWSGEGYTNPHWEYVYDEDGNSVSCPRCSNYELRYHNGRCCCPDCDETFTDAEIEDWAGPWHTSHLYT